MHFLWFLSLLFSSGVSGSSTKLTVEFGQNVTLNCSLSEEEIYWFIWSEPPVYILRSFGRDYETSVFNPQHKEFRDKYSLQTFSRLLIHNVTRNELGLYYCRGVKDNLTFSNGTTLMGKEDHHSPNNVTRIEPQQPQQRPQDYLKSLTSFPFVVSCLLNCIFIILLSVAVKRCSTLKKNNTSVEPPHDSDPPHNSEMMLSTTPRATRIRNLDSSYTKILYSKV
ncbi:uncharacterized protein LOC143142242 [Alosa pseudoharengus]|uniref:uncharacterized protein LOC143142242 n=1 Tax=Alosa pseudoharengus TaxID=34774 RepID=UPI003F8A930C